MKRSMIALAIFAITSVASAACPNFTGTYQQVIGSCTGPGYENSNKGWPLQENLISKVIIEQKGCESITFTYFDTQYKPSKKEVVTVDMKKAKAIEVLGKNSMRVTLYEAPKTTYGICGIKGKASVTKKILLTKTQGGIRIDSSSLVKGLYGKVLPFSDKKEFTCSLDKISRK